MVEMLETQLILVVSVWRQGRENTKAKIPNRDVGGKVERSGCT